MKTWKTRGDGKEWMSSYFREANWNWNSDNWSQ